MQKEEKGEKVMAKFVKSGCSGMLKMGGKVNLGVPRAKVSGKGGSCAKADSRGKGKACYSK